MRDYKREYEQGKERARAEAIEWQLNDSDFPYSYEGLAMVGDYFYRQGRKYGLIKDFRENGIPC